MADGFEIVGTRDVRELLEEIAPKHARNLMRTTVHGIASRIAKQAKQSAPPGTGRLANAIHAERRKSSPDAPISDVTSASRGKKAGAFYWRFVEFGTKNAREHPFVRPAIDSFRANYRAVFTEEFGKKLEKALAREAKKRAKRN